MSFRLAGAVIPAVVCLALLSSAADASKGYSATYSFCSAGNQPCPDGDTPWTGLIADSSGNLYGTTIAGGSGTDCGTQDCGAVFEISASGTETVLYSFAGPASGDGAYPEGKLFRDVSGNLYGTTQSGGVNNTGTVFKISANGSETVLYSFCSATNCTDGGYPVSGVIMDSQGNLIGTAAYDGQGYGTVYKLDPSGNYTVVHSFDGTDGSEPQARPYLDKNGNIFGTVSAGGANGSGGVYEIAADGTYTLLYSFCSQANCSDGEVPLDAVIEDAAGNLYGTTVGGGANGQGVVFELTPSGSETVLYAFCALAQCADGASPIAGLTWAKGKTAFFGTTAGGGAYSQGEAFELSNGALSVLHSFGAGSDGLQPRAPLMRFKNWLYGTTPHGGSYGHGTVFKLGTKGDGTD